MRAVLGRSWQLAAASRILSRQLTQWSSAPPHLQQTSAASLQFGYSSIGSRPLLDLRSRALLPLAVTHCQSLHSSLWTPVANLSTAASGHSASQNEKEGQRGASRESGSADSEGSSSEGAAGSSKASQDESNSSSSSSGSNFSDTLNSSWSRARRVLSSAGGSVAEGFEAARRTRVGELAKKAYEVIKEDLTSSAPRRRKWSVKQRSESTAIVATNEKKTGWQKWWHETSEKISNHPAMQRLRGVQQHPIVAKSQELAEDLRERWETSDSPVVHRIQDMNDSLFGETLQAMAMKEIRRRDPFFSMTEFVAQVQEDVRPVLTAYSEGNLEFLRDKCRREVLERCEAEKRALLVQRVKREHKILHISDVEVRETKLLGSDPIIIVNFQTQQIHCLFDQTGKLVEGGRDEILTMFHAWAMQQSSDEEMLEDFNGPRWRLREMQQMGMQALI